MPTVTFKLSAEEARELRRKARAARTSVSAYLRRSVFGGPPAEPRKIVAKKHPVSGLPYNAAGKSYRTVSQDEIRAALADFP
jgi:hypothetical protein